MFKDLALKVHEVYKSDPTSAGITVSFVERTNLWYMSIKRYHEPFAKGAETVMSEKDSDFDACLNKLYTRFNAIWEADPDVKAKRS